MRTSELYSVIKKAGINCELKIEFACDINKDHKFFAIHIAEGDADESDLQALVSKHGHTSKKVIVNELNGEGGFTRRIYIEILPENTDDLEFADGRTGRHYPAKKSEKETVYHQPEWWCRKFDGRRKEFRGITKTEFYENCRKHYKRSLWRGDLVEWQERKGNRRRELSIRIKNKKHFNK